MTSRFGKLHATRCREHRQCQPHAFDPVGIGVDDDEIGLLEIPVVVGVLLAAQGVRTAVGLVPVTGLLADRLARFEHADLALRLVLDRPADRAHRVDVLDLAARAELSTRQANADVGIDTHRAFLHLGVGGPNGDEDGSQFVDVCLGLLGVADVGTTHDLDQWNAGAVEVDQRVLTAVDSPTRAADVSRLAGVLLQVGALDADPESIGKVEPAVDTDRLVVLTDLVRLGHVRVEVVLAGKGRTLHRAVDGQAEPHGQFDGLAVEHGKCAGQAEGDGVDVGVRFVAETIGGGREELRAGGEFDVHLEPDDHLVAPQRPASCCRVGVAHFGDLRSSSAAVRNIVASCRAGARICTPTGRPCSPVPNGTLMAGSPVRFDGIV